jgi:hypothetical protein
MAIILDISLPHCSDVEILRLIRARCSKMCVVV